MKTLRYKTWFWFMVLVGGFAYLFAYAGVKAPGGKTDLEQRGAVVNSVEETDLEPSDVESDSTQDDSTAVEAVQEAIQESTDSASADAAVSEPSVVEENSGEKLNFETLSLIDFWGVAFFFIASFVLTVLWGIRNFFRMIGGKDTLPGALLFLRISFLTAFTNFFIGGIAVLIVRAIYGSVGFDFCSFATFLVSLIVIGTVVYRDEVKVKDSARDNSSTEIAVASTPVQAPTVDDERERLIRTAYQNHTKEQQNVAYYFAGLKSPLNDKKYVALVESKLKELDFYHRALDRCGIDESEVREVTPILIQGYNFDGDVWVKRTSSGFISSAYQITYIFFTSDRVYLYRANFELDEGGSIPQDESGQGFYFKDVVSLGSQTKSLSIGKYGVNMTVSFSTLVFSMMSGEHFVIPVDSDKTISGVRAKWHEERRRRNLKD